MKVGIVNDMAMCREVIARVVSMDPDCHVIWTAFNGAEAVLKCSAELPDLLIMDLFMPVMDGTEATKRIMRASPCAILIVTASVDANSSKVFETLGNGAIDAIKTPIMGLDGSLEGARTLLRKIAQFKQLLLTPNHARPKRHESNDALLAPSSFLVAIGASTGGPNAVAELLSQIPSGTNAAFIVIQHVDKQFAPGLASWLDSLCDLDVRVALQGDIPMRGVVLIAGTNDHLVMSSDSVLQYTPHPEANPFRPSVDVFFNSLVAKYPGKGMAALLTGIGRDGAAGLLNLRNAGWTTFAQSKDTCVVYGMPKAAAEIDAAEEILSPKEIGCRIASTVALLGGFKP